MIDYAVIRIWRGRAYLHTEWDFLGYRHAKDTPLGRASSRVVDKMVEKYKCNIEFLNEDFSVDDSIQFQRKDL